MEEKKSVFHELNEGDVGAHAWEGDYGKVLSIMVWNLFGEDIA